MLILEDDGVSYDWLTNVTTSNMGVSFVMPQINAVF